MGLHTNVKNFHSNLRNVPSNSANFTIQICTESSPNLQMLPTKSAKRFIQVCKWYHQNLQESSPQSARSSITIWKATLPKSARNYTSIWKSLITVCTELQLKLKTAPPQPVRGSVTISKAHNPNLKKNMFTPLRKEFRRTLQPVTEEFCRHELRDETHTLTSEQQQAFELTTPDSARPKTVSENTQRKEWCHLIPHKVIQFTSWHKAAVCHEDGK